MKGYTKLIGEKGNIHMENIPDQGMLHFEKAGNFNIQSKKISGTRRAILYATQ